MADPDSESDPSLVLWFSNKTKSKLLAVLSVLQSFYKLVFSRGMGFEGCLEICNRQRLVNFANLSMKGRLGNKLGPLDYREYCETATHLCSTEYNMV